MIYRIIKELNKRNAFFFSFRPGYIELAGGRSDAPTSFSGQLLLYTTATYKEREKEEIDKLDSYIAQERFFFFLLLPGRREKRFA